MATAEESEVGSLSNPSLLFYSRGEGILKRIVFASSFYGGSEVLFSDNSSS